MNLVNVCLPFFFVEQSTDDTYLELNQLTGIAAILTFPLDIEVVEAEEEAAQKEKQDLEPDDKEEG